MLAAAQGGLIDTYKVNFKRTVQKGQKIKKKIQEIINLSSNASFVKIIKVRLCKTLIDHLLKKICEQHIVWMVHSNKTFSSIPHLRTRCFSSTYRLYIRLFMEMFEIFILHCFVHIGLRAVLVNCGLCKALWLFASWFQRQLPAFYMTHVVSGLYELRLNISLKYTSRYQ